MCEPDRTTASEASDSEAAFLEQFTGDLASDRELTAEELAETVYLDLRRLARSLFEGEKPGLTLQPTALAHETYLRLADYEGIAWKSRSHFLAAAATAMRRLLAEAARKRRQLKRGGAYERVTLTGLEAHNEAPEWDLLDLEDALQDLAHHKPRHARIAELRYFGGLQMNEIAKVLGVSQTAIDRDWAKARAYLATRLRSTRDD
ncbi:MAG: ECF-type sigma factor [Planctomycetota bacterium]